MKKSIKEERLELITRNTAEIINRENIQNVLAKKNLFSYCGYEPSGEIHLGHLVTITKLLDLQKAGIIPIVLLADWHAYLNNKGNKNFLEKQMQFWEKGIKAAGLKKARFVRGTDFQKKESYINDIMILALNTTINRGVRSMQTISRNAEKAKISQIIYPLMQIEDIKKLRADFVIGGLDQRKIHALGTELFKKIEMKKTPVFLHTGIITSLKDPGEKMSSSIPRSMITIRDSKQNINKKMRKAHCISGETENNPVLEIMKLIIFPRFEKITIKRSAEHGDDLEYKSQEDLEKDFRLKKIHPLDLKSAASEYLEKVISPIRKAFS